MRKLAPLVRVEVNGELWQSGIVSYPVQVRLGDLTLELTGLNDPALPEPLQSAAEDRPERWFRKARHLLRLMRDKNQDILDAIRTEKQISDAVGVKLKAAVDGYAKAFA